MKTILRLFTCLRLLLSLTGIFLSILILLIGCKKEIRSIDFASSDRAIAENELPFTAKPNILFIVGDDVGYEVLTCNGGQSYSTPNLDMLARNGTRFTQAHGSPLCTPSRVTLLTGKYNFRNYTEWGYLTPDNKTIGNMFKDNGYATCYAGKWQLDGGKSSIKAFGWEKYSVFLPFLLGEEAMEGSRYKSPKVYQDGGYLQEAATKNRFSDDIFTDYLTNFIDSISKEGKPFFAYYSMMLCHGPFSPTPDDPEYATWDYVSQEGDASFFPGMVEYMDKKIGEILTFLSNKKLLSNTIIIYVGDNGTPKYISSLYNGTLVTGGKGAISELGTNVPLIAFGRGKFNRNTVSNALIDFTDFMPTLADIAGISAQGNYGILNGKSFYPTLMNGDPIQLRKTIYNSFSVQPYVDNHQWRRWVQNDTYKLYDTNRTHRSYRFVKVAKCQPDSKPLRNLTARESQLKDQFIQILRSYVP